jgi:DNA mismatch repair protein MutS2
VREDAEKLMRSDEYAPYLQDEYVTLREDRFVLPLKASFKSMGLGIVHDTSRTGETVFVEPTRMVELNNRLKVTEIEIRRESRRILEELAALIAGAAPGLRADRDILTRLDVIGAAARLALAYDGEAGGHRPRADRRSRVAAPPAAALRGRGSQQTEVVANDVHLGEVPGKSSARVLVISGPNAGGKTVLLKAVGLAALCARAGLLVPAAPGSKVGFLHQVLADIGDQQSVLGDLSTFSAHLGNIARIVEIVESGQQDDTENLLVLCDELMAGTHPEQGAALARATLESLADGQALVITTTHYDSLKSLTEGDPASATPAWSTTCPGCDPPSACATACPAVLTPWTSPPAWGCPERVLERARALVGGGALDLEEVLRSLETREQALASAEQALEAARAELERRSEQEKAAAQSLARRERELAQKSREVIDRSVRSAREAIAEVVKEVRQQKTLAAAATAREKLSHAARQATEGLPQVPGPGELDVAKLKDALASRALGVGGGSGKSSRSAMREARAAARSQQVPSRDPQREEVPRRPPAGPTPSTCAASEPTRRWPRWRRSWIRSALQGADTVLIIHGHGTGALRRTVREYLATSPYVARFRPGGAGEGGDGVSVVSLRD